MYSPRTRGHIAPNSTLQSLDLMKTLAKEGLTMIIVTHEMDFARNVSSRVLFMADGRVVETGQLFVLSYEDAQSLAGDFLDM